MCAICDGWNRGSGQVTEPQRTTPGSGGAPATSGDVVARDPEPWVTFPRRWADHRGRTLTWSDATRIFSTERQQHIAYHLNDTQVGLIRRAFAVWAAVANVNFRQVADSTSSNIRIGWDRFQEVTSARLLTRYRGPEAVRWLSRSSSSIQTTTIRKSLATVTTFFGSRYTRLAMLWDLLIPLLPMRSCTPRIGARGGCTRTT